MADKFKVNALNIESRKLLTVSSFMGVDYSPAQLSVDNAHAVDILNMIFKDKVNQKRTGWEQIAKANDYVYYIQNNDGDLIEIIGSKSTASIAVHSQSEIGRIIRIDGTTRKNSGASIGDEVLIKVKVCGICGSAFRFRDTRLRCADSRL